MGLTFLTPVDVTPSGFSSQVWTDLDLSANVPAGSTGVVLHVRNASTGDLRTQYRKNGSTDNHAGFIGDLESSSHQWVHVGCDTSQIIEFYHEDTAGNAVVWLVGYWDSDATFNTNYTVYTPGTANVWTDADITPDTGGGAIGAIFVMAASTGSDLISVGARKNGSTDNRVFSTESHLDVVVGVDADEIAEVQVSLTTGVVGLRGWITAGAQFNLNATDVSLTATGAWTNLATLPTGATGAIYETISTSATATFGYRKDGTGEDIHNRPTKQHDWTTVESASLIVEGWISATGVDTFQIGEIGTFGGGGGGGQTTPILSYHQRSVYV